MYIQQIQPPENTPESQQDLKPNNPLSLIVVSCGLVLVLVVLILRWRKGKQEREVASQPESDRSDLTSKDWYRAEFMLDACPNAKENIPLDKPNPEAAITAKDDASELDREPKKDPPPAKDLGDRSDPGAATIVEDDDAKPARESEEDLSPMQDEAPLSLRDRYVEFVRQVVTDTLKGKFASKEHVYTQLATQLKLEPRTGEIFERCLTEQIEIARERQQAATDELKQAKAQQQFRALGVLQEAWNKYQDTQRAQDVCSDALEKLVNADWQDRLSVLLQILDPNQTDLPSRNEIKLLAKELERVQQPTQDSNTTNELQSIATGLKQGLLAYTAIDTELMGWMYERSPSGFGETVVANNSWSYWAKRIQSPLPKLLLTEQSNNRSAFALAQQQTHLDLSAWVELIILLREIQDGLVRWFDKQPYNFKAGNDAAAATFLTFATIWCELSNGFRQAQQLVEAERERLSRACFQIALQILRVFARRDNFPIYGGVFASFTGEGFRETIAYLDRPLKVIEKKQEKARILTILGYSQQWASNRDRALSLHNEALELARQAADRSCEIANLNHLSRLEFSRSNFPEAVDLGQRALLLARQIGEPLGEMNAITNLGYSEIRQAQQREHNSIPEVEACIDRLQRGTALAEKYKDPLSKLLCDLGIGIAYLVLEQSGRAKPFLEKGLAMSVRLGNLELEGLCRANLGEANFQLDWPADAVFHSCLGLYLLEQKNSTECQQVSNLIAVLKGRLGDEAFKQTLQQYRSQIVARVGVDGYDRILELG